MSTGKKMDAHELRAKLEPLQEKQGFYFNEDDEYTMRLLEGLIVNKERYGYMACPCRFASGDYDKDRDIICPCVYRGPDVQEHNACYCALYVSKDYDAECGNKCQVPERRPAELTARAMGLD